MASPQKRQKRHTSHSFIRLQCKDSVSTVKTESRLQKQKAENPTTKCVVPVCKTSPNQNRLGIDEVETEHLAADLELLMGEERMVPAGESGPVAEGESQGGVNEQEDLGGGGLMTWTEYHAPETIDKYMDYLAKTYPGWVSTEVIGNSFECRSMRVLKVCRGGCGGKPAVWIDGGIHAREWISPAVVTYIMMELVEHDSSHPELTTKLDWYILPVANPDGYVFSGCGKMSVDCPFRTWRKTRSCNPEGKTSFTALGWGVTEKTDVCRGADANRNWDIHWETGQDSSDDSCHAMKYRGAEPFSEVENRNIRDFILKHKDDIKMYDSIHSQGGLIVMPYGYSKCGKDECINKPDNFDALLEMAKLGKAAIKAVNGEEYEIESCPACSQKNDGYSGLSQDWAHKVAKIPFSFILELPNSLVAFHPKEEKIIPTGKEVWAFQRAVAEKIITG